jgi:predicted RNA-binding protein YlxR (DUF448 family)
MSTAVPPSVPTGAGPEAAPGTTSPDRRVPQRTCVGCRQVRAKRELVRLVLPAEGPVQVDLTGKRNGRGAYICRETGRTCLLQARKRKALTRALRATADRIDHEALAAQLDHAAPPRRNEPSPR